MMAERNIFFDSLKFTLIFLVVFGHVLGPYLDDSLNLAVRNFIYLFHMPLFIFISGYFSKTNDISKLKKSVLKILETLIVFQVFYSLPKALDQSFSPRDFITPYWILWYVLSLIFWKFIVFFIPKALNKRTVVVLSVLISLAVGFLPLGYPLSLSRTFVFLPFFILGYYFNEVGLEKLRKVVPRYIAFVILTGSAVLLYLWDRDLTLITSGSRSYSLMSDNLWLSCLYRGLFLLLATVLSVSIMKLINATKLSSKLGKDSVLYYVYHGFAVILLEKIVKMLTLPTNLLALFIYSTAIIAAIFIFSKFSIAGVLLNPISYFKERLSKKNYG